MHINSVETAFMNVLKSFNDPRNEYVKKLAGFAYLKNSVKSLETMKRYFDAGIRDASQMKNRIKGKKIIDAGCGSGAFSILLGLLSAKKVYALDFISENLKVAEFMIRQTRLNNVETIHSDIAKLNLPERSIDIVFSIEAISHYKDYKSFLKMSSRVLKKCGFLVVRDCNNGASAIVRRRMYKYWDAWENNLEPIILSGHKKVSNSCFLNMRKDIIRNCFPDLSENEIEQFARYTFGLSKEEILVAVNRFIKGDFFLKSEYVYGKCPLDPYLDWYIDRLFDPFALKQELREYGFKSKIKAVGPASRNLKVLRYFWELLSKITIYFPKAYYIIAKKVK